MANSDKLFFNWPINRACAAIRAQLHLYRYVDDQLARFCIGSHSLGRIGSFLSVCVVMRHLLQTLFQLGLRSLGQRCSRASQKTSPVHAGYDRAGTWLYQ